MPFVILSFYIFNLLDFMHTFFKVKAEVAASYAAVVLLLAALKCM